MNQNPADRPKPKCDLIMKGGVTSGIVYPPLILKLKKNYSFRRIGGTSAGAIAAAITAAAEYGRDKEGFGKLERLRGRITGEETFLRDLFQPSGKTRPLFRFLLDLIEITKGKDRWRRVRLALQTLPFRVPIAFLVGTLLGIGLALALTCLVGGPLSGWGSIVVAVLFGLIGGIVAAIIRLILILIKEVPRNLCGMCTGRREGPEEDLTVLTDWLNDSIDDLADIRGRNKPLTFGDLRGSKQPSDYRIDLKMFTSNLNHSQPYVLPFENHLWIFQEQEFRKLFPRTVVDYMKGCQPRQQKYVLKKEGFFFLPEADDLPVIVATRMSLSFPVLLSAVPLYAINSKAISKAIVEKEKKVDIQESDLQKCWFSDGGISSNFPIHFFDAWLPSCPTFGVNLTSLPDDGLTKDLGKQPGRNKVEGGSLSYTSDPEKMNCRPIVSSDNDVYLPKPDDPPVTEWIPFEIPTPNLEKPIPSLLKFLWAIFTTAQNYRDNTQAMLPSYRERIVQIRLSENQGGLNLVMPQPTIREVDKKGADAGEVLLDNKEFDFEHHQWIRFRVLMKQLEKNLNQMEKTVQKCSFYTQVLSQSPFNPNYSYPPPPCDPEWGKKTAKRLRKIRNQIQRWQREQPPELFEENSPLPDPVLRITPSL